MTLEHHPPRMNCASKLREAILTSISVVCFFYFIDLMFHKYSYMTSKDRSMFGVEPSVYYNIEAARNSNALVMRLDNLDAILREVVSSHKEKSHHVDSAINFYQYKLGLEKEYWDNKQLVLGMKKKLRVLNEEQVPYDDPELVQVIRDFWIHPPSPQEYELEMPNLMDFSMGQSEAVDTIFDHKKNGFFIEAGALDGETRSNTLFFERERGWHGLLIEPGPGNYRAMLGKHRKAYMSPACLANQLHPIDTLFHKGRNRGRLLNKDEAFDWVSGQHMKLKSAEVQCFPLYSFLLALNRTQIDYFSLDIEGEELNILRTIPFDKVNITVLTVEFKHDLEGKEALRYFMESHGYNTVAEITREDNLANDLVFVKDTFTWETNRIS